MTARRVAGLAWGACVAIALPTLVLLALGARESTPADDFGLAGFGGLAFLVAALAFASTGALVASRLPSNAIGWIFCVIGFLLAVGSLPHQYADYALFVSPGSLPGGETAAVIQNLGGVPPAFGLLGLSLLLFPDGRLPSRHWLPVAAVGPVGAAALSVGLAFRPGPLDEPFEVVDNPFGVGSFGLMDALSGLGWMLSALSVALAAAATVVRLRRSSGQVRQQLKWIGLAGAVAGVVFVANALSFFVGLEVVGTLRLVVVGLAFAGFPVAAGVAILRHGLYDIDVVIRRTLVYAGLTAILLAGYLGAVLLLQLALNPLTEDDDLAIAGSTLAVAALFRPARRRIQELVDRRFYRQKFDAQQTLESFGGRLRNEVDLDALAGELRGVVAQTMQPTHVSLWIRTP
ncbi:MAG: hypothetical protein ACR2NB_14645 [Solirubrobacteraceae bacterium]